MKTKIWALAAASLLPRVAAAQDVPTTTPIDRPTTVAERYRPDYAPIGGRLGSFFLFPRASATVVASDNVFASDANKEGDIYGQLLTDARLVSNFSRHQINLRAFVDQSLHARFSRENRTEFGASALGRLDASRNARITAGIVAEKRAEDRTSFNNIAQARAPIRLNYAQFTLAGDYESDRTIFGAGARVDHRNYFDATALDGTIIGQDYRDLNLVEGTLYGGYAVRPGVALLVRGAADKRDYTLAADSPMQPGGLDRDSNGYRIEGGVRLDIGELIYGEARLGYFKRDYADPTLLDPGGVAIGVDLLYNVTRLTSLRLRADRQVDESSTPTIAGNRLTVVGGSVEHEVRRDVIVTALGEYRAIEPIGPNESSNQILFATSGQYLANRRLRFMGEYRFDSRSSPEPFREFTEHRLTAGVMLML